LTENSLFFSQNATAAPATRTFQMMLSLTDMCRSSRRCDWRPCWARIDVEAPNLNDVYVRFFPDPPPARTVCGARLPDGVKVIIECTALV